MKQRLATVCMSLILSVPATAGDVGMAKVGAVMIHDGWARASIGSAPNSAAYMTLMTQGDAADKLVGAKTQVAETVEIHNHIIEDGIAKMREVKSIDVKPGEMATLEPGGFHVMLMGLKEPLKDGDLLPLTLIFEHAGEVKLEVPIKDLKGSTKHGESKKHGG